MDTTKVLSIFDQICQIPRESGHEELIIAWLQKFAADRSLECKTDEAGNVVITKEASEGMGDAPTIVLQSHSDMVCEKNRDSKHDFRKDPIKYVIEDGWMIAKETTLGADCGIGMAAQLAILDDNNIIHPKIEALFTTEEEIGLNGAKALKPGFITGNYLINLDSEDEGELFIGCAGGVDTTAIFNYKTVSAPANHTAIKISITGGTGGHSGDDIDKNRVNANLVLARILNAANKQFGIYLSDINGGNKRNAIAREAFATILTKQENSASVIELFDSIIGSAKKEFHKTDPNLSGEAVMTHTPDIIIEKQVSDNIILSLNAALHGVLAMSRDINGLVETSTNLASVKITNEGEITICTNQRSSVVSSRDDAAARVESLFILAGAKVTHSSEYPGWEPNIDSKLLKVSKDAYKELFRTEPIVRAIHAGLECGMFLDTYPNLDMISFGPTLRGVHAPGEKMDLASVDKFWKLLLKVIKTLR